MKRLPDKIRLLLALMVVIFTYCANPGTPTGGPRDRKPPVMVSSKPEMGATNFAGKEVLIYFNENIQLGDANSKFVMSPPMEKQPSVTSHANWVKVAFNDECELMPSTTYTLDFADLISDLNEGNVLEGFTFAFSTGESTDSMMISGNVYDAATLAPVKSIYVVLQANTQDTAFKTVPPVRIAKTDDYGRFSVKNVPDNKYYRIYALDDQNRNFRFDQPGEKIAWLRDSIFPSMEWRQYPDSIEVDSIGADSTIFKIWQPTLRDSLVYTPDSLCLFAYDEYNYDQYITNDSRPNRNKVQLVFNNPMDVKPKISFVGQDSTIQHSVNEFSPTNDTVTVWMTDTLIWKKDSVVLSVEYPVLDTLGNMVSKFDTLQEWHFEYKPKEKKNDKKKKPEKPVKAPLLKLNIPTSVHSYAAVSITSQTPYKTFDWDHVHLFHKEDTLFIPQTFTTADDTINLKRKTLKSTWIPGDDYRLAIDSAGIYDIYDLPCDSVIYNFKIVDLEKYGTLYIDVDSVPEDALLQLTGKSDAVVRQLKLPKNGKAAFRYIMPGDYMLRILIDENHNGQWDYGDFDNGILPERLIYYMEKITVRANWDIHINFEVDYFTVDKYVQKFKIDNKKRR